MSAMIEVGVISDTHGLLRPEATAALQGCGLILHAGDIGRPEVLEELARIAPVRAVRGNNDRDTWAHGLPECEIITLSGVQVYMVHDVNAMRIDASRAGHDVVISGHSHKPMIEERNGVMFLNPGAAGPRRFNLPVSVARLEASDGHATARIIELDVPTRKRRRPGTT